jgi:ribosomal protein L3 glutamine methyltransferase
MQADFSALKQEFSTIRDWLRWGTSQLNDANKLFGQGNLKAYEEAKNILLVLLQIEPELLDQFFESRMLEHEAEHYVNFIERRKFQRLPMPYLTNCVWYNNKLYAINDSVNIPRGPLIPILSEILPNHFSRPPSQILNLCASGGFNGIELARMYPDAQVTCADNRDEAIELVNTNVDNYELSSRVKAVKSNLYQSVPKQNYDLILLTVPKRCNEDTPSQIKSDKNEDSISNSLSLVTQTLANSLDFLSERGVVVIELEESRIHLVSLLPQIKFNWLNLDGEGSSCCIFSYLELKAIKSSGRL